MLPTARLSINIPVMNETGNIDDLMMEAHQAPVLVRRLLPFYTSPLAPGGALAGPQSSPLAPSLSRRTC